MVGMRIHSMRTPVQREQNFAVEGMINEVAAAVGADPIEYRMRHTADQRLIDVFTRLKSVHGWETRPSPTPTKANGLDRDRAAGWASCSARTAAGPPRPT